MIDVAWPEIVDWRPGDAVFGSRTGAFGEDLVARADGTIARKPAKLGFDEAAAMLVAALTALQALRDKGALVRGQKVLINGAAGGVGSFAVQVAKSVEPEVHGVRSTRDAALARSR